MIEMSTAYGIGPDKYGDELQTIRIGNGALNVNWIKQCAEAALDAEREKVKGQTQRAEYAEGKVRELLLKQDALELELSQLQALVRAFFTSEDKWVVAYRELERLGYTWTPRRLKMASILRAEVQEKMKIGMPFGAKSKNEAKTEANKRKRIN